MRSRFLPILLLSLTAFMASAGTATAGVDRWTALGPDGGDVWSLTADPAAPGTIYAGIFRGGVWKSTDGGDHWIPTPEGLGSEVVFALAVSSGRVLAGTGSGIFILTEGAATWRKVWHDGGDPSYVTSLAADPTSPDRVWAGTSAGEVLSTEDGGEHWLQRLDVSSTAIIAVAPTTPSTTYVEASGDTDDIYKSTDAGATWKHIIPHPPEGGDGLNPDTLVVDSADPDTLYLPGWKSVDGGESWSEKLRGAFPVLSLSGSLIGRDLDGLLRSEDGETWDRIELPSTYFLAVAADPFSSGSAFAGAEGLGVFRLLDGGRSWTESNRGLSASDITGFAFDPFQRHTLYAATSWQGLQRSNDGGASWRRLSIDPVVFRHLTADPHQQGTLYAMDGSALVVSRDRGETWQPALTSSSLSLQSLALSPHRSGTIFAGGRKLMRSRNGGRTWTELPIPPPDSSGFRPLVKRIFLAPWTPENIFLLEEQAGKLFLARSRDEGRTQSTIFDRDPATLAFDPKTPGLLYLANQQGEIWKSRNHGTTWKRIAQKVALGALPTDLVVDTVDPAILYLGTDARGVWRSRDGGTTWERFSSGIIAPQVTCLKADPKNPRHLIACTRGGGLLEIQVSSKP